MLFLRRRSEKETLFLILTHVVASVGCRSGQPNNNSLIVIADYLPMGGRGSRRALFYRYFRLGGSLALPVRLLRCPIANLNLGITGNHYWPINGLLFASHLHPIPIRKIIWNNTPVKPNFALINIFVWSTP
uniref:Uncharacterized protein n=1 Tax=Candidatus Kentrum sp. DK TaxID=2126562 RepID=A0A450RTV6_9GAMM|nr:MAG: hypothetical protein BECKDK2373B_GA0170837_100214 [Candidatus Kentron sp. DK]